LTKRVLSNWNEIPLKLIRIPIGQLFSRPNFVRLFVQPQKSATFMLEMSGFLVIYEKLWSVIFNNSFQGRKICFAVFWPINSCGIRVAGCILVCSLNYQFRLMRFLTNFVTNQIPEMGFEQLR